LLRQVVFFQLRRPREAYTLVERFATLAERPEHWPILVVAALGLSLLLISTALPGAIELKRREQYGYQFKRPAMAGWSLVLIWAVINTLVFASTPRVEDH